MGPPAFWCVVGQCFAKVLFSCGAAGGLGGIWVPRVDGFAATANRQACKGCGARLWESAHPPVVLELGGTGVTEVPQHQEQNSPLPLLAAS